MRRAVLPVKRRRGLPIGPETERAEQDMFNRREPARLSAYGAAASLAAPAFAQSAGSVAFHPLSSDNVPGELGMAVYHPPGYCADAEEPCPLLL